MCLLHQKRWGERLFNRNDSQILLYGDALQHHLISLNNGIGFYSGWGAAEGPRVDRIWLLSTTECVTCNKPGALQGSFWVWSGFRLYMRRSGKTCKWVLMETMTIQRQLLIVSWCPYISCGVTQLSRSKQVSLKSVHQEEKRRKFLAQYGSRGNTRTNLV